MTHMQRLFRWAQFLADKDARIPPKDLRVVGSRYIVISSLSTLNAYDCTNDIVTLVDDDKSDNPWFKSKSGINKVAISWLRLQPYYDDSHSLSEQRLQ